MTPPLLTRRRLIAGGAAFGGLLLAGCDRLSASPTFRDLLARAEPVTMASQRGLLAGGQLAREFKPSDISPLFRANGSVDVADPAYRRMAQSGFSDYALSVTGMVARPLRLSLETLRGGVQRTQITRHDCVEGWSCIAKWTGTPLALVLDQAVVKSEARYVVFHCLDTIERSLSGEVKYYGSVDLVDARHPQTILAYGLNGKPLPVENGAPLRVRVERQLGYKMPKYLQKIELVDSFAAMGLGRGGYWEDRGYDWFGGI